MSTETDLKSLEPWVSVIDPRGELQRKPSGQWWHEPETFLRIVDACAALDIRLEQARKWIRARCKDTGDSFDEGYHPAAFSPHCYVEIDGAWMGEGDSPAEALADAIKNIRNLYKKGGD